MIIRTLVAVLAVTLSACGRPTVDEPGQVAGSQVQPAAATGVSTAAVEQGGIINAAFWENPATDGQDLIIGAVGSGGLEFYTTNGERAGSFRDVQAGFVNVLD